MCGLLVGTRRTPETVNGNSRCSQFSSHSHANRSGSILPVPCTLRYPEVYTRSFTARESQSVLHQKLRLAPYYLSFQHATKAPTRTETARSRFKKWTPRKVPSTSGNPTHNRPVLSAAKLLWQRSPTRRKAARRRRRAPVLVAPHLGSRFALVGQLLDG